MFLVFWSEFLLLVNVFISITVDRSCFAPRWCLLAVYNTERLGVNVCAHMLLLVSLFLTVVLHLPEPLHSSQRQFPSCKGVRMSLKNLRAQGVATAPLMSSFFSLTATQDSRLLKRLGKQSNEYKGGSRLKTYPGSGVAVFWPFESAITTDAPNKLLI